MQVAKLCHLYAWIRGDLFILKNYGIILSILLNREQLSKLTAHLEHVKKIPIHEGIKQFRVKFLRI